MPLNHSSKCAELTDVHFKTIGKIVVEWSNIEFLLGVILSRLLLTPAFLARSYTDHMSAVKLQEAIKEGVKIQKQRYSCKSISKEKLDQILSINNRVTVLRATRNKFAHFCWMRSDDENIFGTNFSGGIPEGRKYKKSCTTYSISELENFYSESYKIVDELSALVHQLPEMREDELVKKFK